MEMHEETNFDDYEERYRARQRRASFGGLLAGLFILILFGAGLVAGIVFWPSPEIAPVSQPSAVPKPVE